MSNDSTPPPDQGRRKDKGKAQQVNKCQNEKKRREQENHYMEELAEYISANFRDLNYPMIKPDKCGILEKTVSEVKRIQDEVFAAESGGESSSGGEVGGGGGGGSACGNSGSSGGGGSDVVQQSQVSSSKPSPNILAGDVIGPLLLEALDGFLFMVNSEGRLEFVSENVTQYLRYTQDDLVGKSVFSIVNQADHATFRRYLEPILSRSNSASSSDVQRNRNLTFECSMIIKSTDDGAEDVGISSLHGMRTEQMQILAIWQQSPHDKEADSSSTDCEGQSYLACIARRIGLAEKTVTVLGLKQFTTKQDLSGKILDCDTSTIIHGEALGQEFIDTNILDFCHNNDKERLKKHHDEVRRNGSNTSGIYRFRMQSRFVFVQTKSKLFTNPNTKLPEFIMSTHSIVRDCEGPTELRGSLQASLMQAIIGGQSTANGNRDLQRHGNHLGRVSSVNNLNQLLVSNDDLPNDTTGLNGLIDVTSCSAASENSRSVGMSATGFPQLADAAPPRSAGAWGSGFHGDFSCLPQVGSSSVAVGQRPPRGIKRRATSPASATALRSPGLAQRSPVGYFSSPAGKRSAHATPSPLPNLGAQQLYGANNKNSYLFQDESDLSALFDSVQGDGLGQPENNHVDSMRILGSTASRPTSQGAGFPMDWNNVSPPALSPLQALKQLQVNSISTFKDDIHMFNRTQRRSKRDQNGSSASTTNGAGLSGAPVSQVGLSRSSASRPFQDLRLRELLINDDDSESQSSFSVDARRRDAKVLPVLGDGRRTPRSADPESSKSPQWLMNPSPQQPQSTTFVDDHPDSSSNKDSSSNGRQTASTKNKILIELLRQEDNDEDEDTAEADPGLSAAAILNCGKQAVVPGAMSVLKVLAKLEEVHGLQHQPVVSALPDTSASPRDQDVEPTSNSGTGSSNNLLKKLLNSTEDICKGEVKAMKHTELLQKLLSDDSDDVVDSNTGPVVESTSNGELEADGKATSSSNVSSNETSPTVSEEKTPFCRLGVPKGDKLKEMLTNLWENEGGLKTRISTSTFKNSKVSVDEAVADSTEFVPESLPLSSSSALSSNFSRGSENKNKLLLSLLQGSQPTLGSILNTGNISAVATVTPQMTMANVKFMRENSNSSSNLLDLEQAVKMATTSSSSSSSANAPVAVPQSDAVNWPQSKAKTDGQPSCQAAQVATSRSSLQEKLYKDTSEDDLNILQDCLSQNGFFDSPMNPYIDKLLDEFAQTSDGLDDDTTILSQIEQFIMTSSLSIPEVDSLLQIGGDDKSSFLDPSEEVAIGAIQQQLMSIESASTTPVAKPGTTLSLGLDSQFTAIQERGAMGGNATPRLPSRNAAASGSEASRINDLMKEFQMLESQENAALSLPAATQTKSSTQGRHVVNQLQKILSSRNQEKTTSQQQQLQQQQQQRPVVAPNNSQISLLGRNVANSSGLKSPMTPQSKTGFTLMDSSAADVGLIANLSEMMNVPHPPNKVAPSSEFRSGSLPQRLASQSSVDTGAVLGQAGSDLQRALMSCGQWNPRDVSIMAGGAVVQASQSGRSSISRPGTAGMMSSMDDLIGGSVMPSGGNHLAMPHNDIIDDLLASMLPVQQQQQQQLQQQQQQLQQQQQQQLQQQQVHMRVTQSQQPPGASLGDLLSEQVSGRVQVNTFRDPMAVSRPVKLPGTNQVQSPMNVSSRSNPLSSVMSPPSGNHAGGGITSPMPYSTNGLQSPSLGGSLASGSPVSSGMMSPVLGMNPGFLGSSGSGHKTPSGYPIGDLQVAADGRAFGAIMHDRQSQRNANPSTSGSLCEQVKSESSRPAAPKASGTSKNTKQALKLSIQSRTSGSHLVGQPQLRQRSPAGVTTGSLSLPRNDRTSQYYLQTGSEMVEVADDCSGLMDCLSPKGDGFLGLPRDGSDADTVAADDFLGLIGSHSQPQLVQQSYQRQTSLSDQRSTVTKTGLSARQDDRSLGFGQTLTGETDSQPQVAPLVQMSDMAANQSQRLGYRPQPAGQLPQQMRGGGGVVGVKQQTMLASNQIQRLSDAGLQQQQQQAQGMMQQSGQHHLRLGVMQLSSGQHQQLGVVQQTDQQLASLQQSQQQHHQLTAIQQQQQSQQQHQQLTAMQQQQQQSQQQHLVAMQQQQQSQQLHLAALQQQNQQQQIAAMQQQQQIQAQQLSSQQLGMMQQHQQLQHAIQMPIRATEVQQHPQMGLPNAQQRLASQGIPTQGSGQWGGIQQTVPLSPMQTDPTIIRTSQRPDARSVPQSPSEFGRKVELLQQLMAGSPLPPGTGRSASETSRASILHSGGGALQESSPQVTMNAGTQQQSGNDLLLMAMQGFDVLQGNGSHFLHQTTPADQPTQKSSGSTGFSGNSLADEELQRPAATFVYPNDNSTMRKARDESRSTSEDFIRLGLQKLINEHVHKDSATSKTRTSGTTIPLFSSNSWDGGSNYSGYQYTFMQQDPGTSCTDSKSGNVLVSPFVQSPSIGGQKPTLGDALQASTAVLRPKTTTALLEKLLSEETG